MKPFPLPYRASLLVAFDLPQPAPARADNVSIGSESKLRPERSGRYWYADVINVDPGSAEASFVQPRAGNRSGTGPRTGCRLGRRPRSDSGLRRIDFGRLCQENAEGLQTACFDPWLDNPEFRAHGDKKIRGRGLCKGSRPVGP